ncbi:MAG TPA: hypothetical protein PK084_04275 [Novosphingobium sp.]|mgnify:CR=1 FL=1|nr:hypothetical protein [Novosphingobium sp.]
MALERQEVELLAELAAEIEMQRRPVWHFAQWLRAEVECHDATAEEPAGALLSSFHAWCDRKALARVNATAFGRLLGSVGIGRRKRGKGRVVRVGCKLRVASPRDRSAADIQFERWLAERCDRSDPTSRINATELFRQFEQFIADCDVSEGDRMTQTAFGRRLSALGIGTIRAGAAGRVDRVGIRLKDGRQIACVNADNGTGDLFAAAP